MDSLCSEIYMIQLDSLCSEIYDTKLDSLCPEILDKIGYFMSWKIRYDFKFMFWNIRYNWTVYVLKYKIQLNSLCSEI